MYHALIILMSVYAYVVTTRGAPMQHRIKHSLLLSVGCYAVDSAVRVYIVQPRAIFYDLVGRIFAVDKHKSSTHYSIPF
jgi:hypothetical protein